MRSCTARSREIAVNRPEPAAARRQEQFAEGRRHLVERILAHILHHQHARMVGIVERRRHRGAHGRARQMRGAGAAFGGSPIGFEIAGAVAQGRRGDQHAVARLGDEFGERNGRVDPVAMKAGVEFAPFGALDREPIDEFGIGLLHQTGEHVAPRGQRHQRAAFDAARHRLDALPHARIERAGLGVEQRRQGFGQCGERRGQAREAPPPRPWPRRPDHRPAGAARIPIHTGRQRTPRGHGPVGAPARGKLSQAPLARPSARRWCQPGPGSTRAAASASSSAVRALSSPASRSSQRRLVRARGWPDPPRRRAASAATRPPRPPRAAPKTRYRRRRTHDGLRRTPVRSGGLPSSSPPIAACTITSAWLATTMSARRARRMVRSMKHLR